MVPLHERSGVLFDLHPLWLDAVERVLTGLHLRIVAKTTSRAKVLDLVAQHRPDLVVVGIEANGADDGIDLVERARALAPRAQIVALATEDDPMRVKAALSAGATAYVLKTVHPDDLAAAVRQTFGHSVYFADSPPTSLADRNAARPYVGLTARELEILRLVAEGRPNRQLARMLWVTEQTVKFHLSNIYRKLDVSNRTEASRWAQANGLLSAEAVHLNGDSEATERRQARARAVG
jgi:DNA-binding NarL/FixJ family response regulator